MLRHSPPPASPIRMKLHLAPLLTAALLLLCGPAFAQDAPAAPTAVESTDSNAQSLLDYLLEGGPWLMGPLAVLSFIAVLLIIFYTFTIRQGAVVSDKFMNAADALIRKQDYLGLIAVCNRGKRMHRTHCLQNLGFRHEKPHREL